MAKMCFSIMFSFLVALYMSPNSVKALPNPVVEEAILEHSFPDKYEMPADCEGKSFCFTKGDNYPDERIAELLADMRELKVDNPEAQSSIGSRNKRQAGALGYDEPNCPSNSTESPIYYIVDDNDAVRVVVQSPNRFLQINTVRWCLNEGRINSDTPYFPRSLYTSFAIECVTTKMDYSFFVLSDEVDPNTNKPKMETAKAKGGIPVCCRCQYSYLE